VLGGVLSLAGPYILPRAQQEVKTRVLDVAHQGVEITLSAFKFDACVMGGAALILHEILNNPTLWHPKPPPTRPSEDHVRLASAL
jgi:hypothetical protein